MGIEHGGLTNTLDQGSQPFNRNDICHVRPIKGIGNRLGGIEGWQPGGIGSLAQEFQHETARRAGRQRIGIGFNGSAHTAESFLTVLLPYARNRVRVPAIQTGGVDPFGDIPDSGVRREGAFPGALAVKLVARGAISWDPGQPDLTRRKRFRGESFGSINRGQIALVDLEAVGSKHPRAEVIQIIDSAIAELQRLYLGKPGVGRKRKRGLKALRMPRLGSDLREAGDGDGCSADLREEEGELRETARLNRFAQPDRHRDGCRTALIVADRSRRLNRKQSQSRSRGIDFETGTGFHCCSTVSDRIPCRKNRMGCPGRRGIRNAEQP